MADVLRVSDVVAFLELTKTRAELSFRLAVSENEDEKTEIRKKLESVQGKISRIYGLIDRADVALAIPNESRIAQLNDGLSGHSPHEILEAMKQKQGEIYGKLCARGEFSKRNYANRENIAKLSIFISTFQKEVRNAVVSCVRAGSVEGSIMLINVDERGKKKLAAFLARLGILARVEENMLVPSEHAGYEVELEMANRKVWVQANVSEQLIGNISNMKQVSSRIQLKNAVRQIKEFSEEEEKEFASMQNQYLSLLKEQDELLREFLDEEKLSREI